MFTTVCQKAKKKANLSVPTGLFLYLFVLCLFVCLFVLKKKLWFRGSITFTRLGCVPTALKWKREQKCLSTWSEQQQMCRLAHSLKAIQKAPGHYFGISPCGLFYILSNHSAITLSQKKKHTQNNTIVLIIWKCRLPEMKMKAKKRIHFDLFFLWMWAYKHRQLSSSAEIEYN